MDFFTIDNILTLLMLTMLQAVLGFDNFLYISMESKRVEERDRQRVRQLGISIAQKAVTMIVVMNVVFSFDSILGAIALTDNFMVMAIAVIISGILMIWLADRVSEFLQKNRMYEVLGLFVLLLVGVMLLSEGGHIAHLAFFGHAIEAMSKSTFYFVIAVFALIDVVQGSYQRNLLAIDNHTQLPSDDL
jgi:predicted tellurium resistance membrane protein TerC